MKDLRSSVAIEVRLSRDAKSQWNGQIEHVESREAITGDSEGNNVVLFVFNKDFNKSDVENDTFHQHPHKGDKQEVVKKNCYDLTMNWNYNPLSSNVTISET